jgi:hypothetical protein
MTTEQPVAVNSTEPSPDQPHNNGWRTFGIVVITMILTLAVGYWAVTTWLFPSEFNPVVLNERQQQILDEKIQRLGGKTQSDSAQGEAYSEAGASREVEFNEREINSLLARNTDLADKLSIDFSENLVSAKLLVDMDPDFPLLGGKTVKVAGGMELRLIDGKPSAILKGISIWGVPIPNAWVGNMKNVDLMQHYGETGGVWKAISDGIESIEVKDGKLLIELKE